MQWPHILDADLLALVVFLWWLGKYGGWEGNQSDAMITKSKSMSTTEG